MSDEITPIAMPDPRGRSLMWDYLQAWVDRQIIEGLLLKSLVPHERQRATYENAPSLYFGERRCVALQAIPNQCRALVGPVRRTSR